MRSRRLLIVLVAAAALSLGWSASAQETAPASPAESPAPTGEQAQQASDGANASGRSSIPWFSLDGSAGFSKGPGTRLQGTAGQPDVGPSMSGGDYALSGGFWGGELSGVTWYRIFLPLVVRNATAW